MALTSMTVQVKICGLTDVGEAVACAEAGADAIGFVFYPPSPRNVTAVQAGEIIGELPPRVVPVGVFVDMPVAQICEVARVSGIRTVQLHGSDDAETVRTLQEQQLRVVKVLKRGGSMLLEDAAAFSGVDAFLVECGQGRLPGGNAVAWDWGAALPLSGRYPMAVAGGLTAGNVGEAIAAALPDAVDVSSAVECEPGRKDLKRVEAFISHARSACVNRQIDRVF